MREWIEELSQWIEDREQIPPILLLELSEEMHQMTLETDVLLQASDQLQSAYLSLCEKAVG